MVTDNTPSTSMETCDACNGAGGDNQHIVCGKCDGAGGYPMTDNIPLVERVAAAIRDVTGGENYDYMDFCRDAAGAALASLPTIEQIDKLREALEAFEAIMAVGGEINPSNYNHEDVCALNNAFIEQFQIAEAAKAALAASRPVDEVIDALREERQRQMDVEGWTRKHDDSHKRGDLARAAACYAVGSINVTQDRGSEAERGWPWKVWPWKRSWWKPTDTRRNLVKAGALIIAEIERIDRAALASPVEEGGVE